VATTYHHTDAIGSVRALSDDTGATVIRHDYLPFGEDTQPLTGDPMRFAGKELDPESALMNFEARYYRNTWGRFTQVDPIGGSLTDPQNWNRYAYARNNPMAYGDPTGLEFTCAVASAMTCADTSTVSAVSASAGPVDIFPGGIPKIGTGAAPVYWVATHATNPDLVAEGFCGGMTDDILYTTWSCPENSGSGGLSLATSAQATTTTTTTTTTDTPTNPNPPPTIGAEPRETFWELLVHHPFQNPCITDALKAGALSAGLDAVGLILEAGGFARMIGHGAGYRGVVADQLDASIINAFNTPASAMSGATNASDTSASGLTSTALTIAGFIPALGEVASGASLVLDTYKTINAIGQCRD
jgi:RHS repeat-associated protein